MVRYNYLVPIVAKPCFTFSYLGVSFIDFQKEKTPQSIEITAFLVRLPGLEPGASGLGGSRSILLSYGDNYKILCVLPLAFFEKASDKVQP